MIWKSFSAEVPGKWVLAGEHTVLRGGKAVALPHPTLKLKLEFRPSEKDLVVEPSAATEVIRELFWIAEKWLLKRGITYVSPRGTLKIASTIPFGAGFGSSAALSVAMSRWMLSAFSIDRLLERELARELENRFHGQSSGMDVSVVSLAEPILFSMKDGAVSLGLQHLPEFHFIDTEMRASTKDCIELVNLFRASHAEGGFADQLDAEMSLAVSEVLDGLRAYDEAVAGRNTAADVQAREKIAQGMRRSFRVYQAWGLVPAELEPLFQTLSKSEFPSARLTGAGGGGFIVSLKA